MRKHGIWATIFALGFGVAAISGDVAAKPGEKKGTDAKTTAQAGVLENVPKWDPAEIKLGSMTQKELIKLYNKVIDADYLKRFQEAEPGIQMDRLKTEVDQKKEDFKTSYVAFDEPPSSYDGTNFTAEFTYGNSEGAMKIQRKDRWRHYFFIKNKVWKIIELVPVGEGSSWGADFPAAVKKIEEKLGVPGKKVAADPAKGIPFEEVEWADGSTRFRLINYDKKMGMSWVDKGTESRLNELRTTKAQKKEEIDKSVSDVLRTPSDQAPPKKEKGKPEKKPKGKS
jgi:hypothetical protein